MVSVNSPGKTTFVDAVVSGFRNTTNFRGVASRHDFWYWILFVFLIRLVTTTADAFIYPEDVNLNTTAVGLQQMASEMATAVQHSLASVTFGVEILFLVPTLAVTVRRFRDAGWKTWLAFYAFAGIYASVAISLGVASMMLSVLTVAGVENGDQASLVAGFLILVFTLLLEFSSMLIIVIGGSQPTKTIPAE
jgi:uncharacterized membrane protein YhaH (DUF805 family)